MDSIYFKSKNLSCQKTIWSIKRRGFKSVLYVGVIIAGPLILILHTCSSRHHTSKSHLSVSLMIILLPLLAIPYA